MSFVSSVPSGRVFSRGQICVSQALRSLVILVHCFLRPVNLSPLSKSLLSMHTQPSRLSLLVQSQGHTSVTSLFILYFFSLLVMLRISLFTGKCVLFFKFQVYPSKSFFFFFLIQAFHDTKLEITAIIFSEKGTDFDSKYNLYLMSFFLNKK